MKTSRKFATSPDILVAKRKNSVADATALVAISSPEKGKCQFEEWKEVMTVWGHQRGARNVM